MKGFAFMGLLTPSTKNHIICMMGLKAPIFIMFSGRAQATWMAMRRCMAVMMVQRMLTNRAKRLKATLALQAFIWKRIAMGL